MITGNCVVFKCVAPVDPHRLGTKRTPSMDPIKRGLRFWFYVFQKYLAFLYYIKLF